MSQTMRLISMRSISILFGIFISLIMLNAKAESSATDVYNRSCIACHQSGVAGAPKTGDIATWQQRLEAAGGMDGLVESAWRGKGAMPPKGICGTCSKEDMKAAIELMMTP